MTHDRPPLQLPSYPKLRFSNHTASVSLHLSPKYLNQKHVQVADGALIYPSCAPTEHSSTSIQNSGPMPDLLYDQYNKSTSLIEKGHDTPWDGVILTPGLFQMAKLLTLRFAKGTAWRGIVP